MHRIPPTTKSYFIDSLCQYVISVEASKLVFNPFLSDRPSWQIQNDKIVSMIRLSKDERLLAIQRQNLVIEIFEIEREISFHLILSNAILLFEWINEETLLVVTKGKIELHSYRVGESEIRKEKSISCQSSWATYDHSLKFLLIASGQNNREGHLFQIRTGITKFAKFELNSRNLGSLTASNLILVTL